MSCQHSLISKCAKFHCHSAYNSDVTGRAFLALLLQIKDTTPDNINSIQTKNQLPQVRQKRIFSISLNTQNFKKTCVAVSLRSVHIMPVQKMQFLSRFKKQIRFLLFAIDIFGQYAWAVSLKHNKGIIIADAFQKTLNKSGSKPNKKSIDKWLKVFSKSLK